MPLLVIAFFVCLWGAAMFSIALALWLEDHFGRTGVFVVYGGAALIIVLRCTQNILNERKKK